MELSTRGRLEGLSKALGAREIFISWTTQRSPVVAVDGGALTGWRGTFRTPPLPRLHSDHPVSGEYREEIGFGSSDSLDPSAYGGLSMGSPLPPPLWSPSTVGNIEVSIVSTWFYSFPAYYRGTPCPVLSCSLILILMILHWKFIFLCGSHFNHPK